MSEKRDLWQNHWNNHSSEERKTENVTVLNLTGFEWEGWRDILKNVSSLNTDSEHKKPKILYVDPAEQSYL